MFKVSEVYEKLTRVTKERADGSEYINFDKVYDSREVLLNPHYIVSIHPYGFTSEREKERIVTSFPQGTHFSSLVLDGHSFRQSEIIVVGSFQKFCALLEVS